MRPFYVPLATIFKKFIQSFAYVLQKCYICALN